MQLNDKKDVIIVFEERWMMKNDYSKQTSWAADEERESRVHRILSAGTNPALNVAAVPSIKLTLLL